MNSIMKRYLLLMTLAACTPVPEPETPEDLASCKADEFPFLIGQTTDDLEETKILQPVRIIRPGAIVTQDYLPQRMNIHVNNAGTVTRLSCG
ncbi:I78 family peptidase inhibitor [Pseudaestuariivita rosea]|uniref:I78 family peptidase inhibitor n=1 Tax=Pseudaestuariivita rosea TaxID=2763263 RepID=UPI001ABA497D|nr:I78 family peptidase inhibitor [Pseudaestuariivita rosea]